MEIPELVKMYAPFAKIDEEKHMVFGYATTPSKDSQGEIIDLDASFEAVDEWKKWANIKEMHRPETAAGTALIIEKHVGVGVYIGVEVVDEQAWQKCLKKVYKGFSIGGRVLERDPDNSKRITKYRLNEISLVDRYANPDSPFMVAKRDASTEEEKGGDSVSENKETSTPAVGKEVTGNPPKAEEKKAVVTKPATPVVAAADESITVKKADFEKLQSQVQEMEKALNKAKENDVVADAIIKAVEKLEPKIKKVHEEMELVEKTEEQKKQDKKDELNKMSVGQLTSMMLKGAPAPSGGE